MLIDLQHSASAQTVVQADVVVIGAGLAGLLAASRLARLGVRTIVLESGGHGSPEGHLDPLNGVVQAGQNYLGATRGRSRGLGGTSRQWGGAMLPFLPCDIEAHTSGWGPAWPVAFDDLAPYFEPIERLFELPRGPFDASPMGKGMSKPAPCNAFDLRSAKWPRFNLRNMSHVLASDIESDRLAIWLNATVDGFRLAENGRLSHVTARSLGGNTLEVEAGQVILAAGAIESTRLLLLLDAGYDNRIFAPDDQLGRYFYDHLSTAAATVSPASRAGLNRVFGLELGRSGMRDLRIEPTPTLRRQDNLPAAFAHIASVSPTDSSFVALRAFYRELQSNASVDWRQMLLIARDMPWLLQAAWWRFANGRLLYPRQARFELMLVTEQMPNAASTITLSPCERDPLGLARAVIDWRTSPADIEAFAALQQHLCTWWAASPFADLAQLTPIEPAIWQERLQSDADVFHPGGTTRMGLNRSNGVVDRNLQTFAIPNLHVVSTSTFPSGGGANPTFMLLAFAMRAADRLAASGKTI